MSRSKRYTRNLGRSRRETVPRGPGSGTRFVRFAHGTDNCGVFSYVSDARRSFGGDRSFGSPQRRLQRARDLEEMEALLAWFGEHLESPARLVPVVYDSDDTGEGSRGVCWFRAGAVEHVVRARRLALLLRRAGVDIVEWRRDEFPGQICWEDAAQVVFAPIWS
jgi:hypothetical protein